MGVLSNEPKEKMCDLCWQKKGSFIPYLTQFDSSFLLLNLINSKGRYSFQNCYYEAETKNRNNRTVARAANRFQSRFFFFLDWKGFNKFSKHYLNFRHKSEFRHLFFFYWWENPLEIDLWFSVPGSANDFESRGRKKRQNSKRFGDWKTRRNIK